MEKRSNFFSFPQYFQYISNFKNLITYIFVKCVTRIIFSSILQIWYVEVRISRSISESSLEFEITRVDCMDILWRQQSRNAAFPRHWLHKSLMTWHGNINSTSLKNKWTNEEGVQLKHRLGTVKSNWNIALEWSKTTEISPWNSQKQLKYHLETVKSNCNVILERSKPTEIALEWSKAT